MYEDSSVVNHGQNRISGLKCIEAVSASELIKKCIYYGNTI